MSTKEDLGWNVWFEEKLRECSNGMMVPARVVGEEKNLFRLDAGTGTTFWGEISGRMHYEAASRLQLPATGDWVACVWAPGNGRAIIHHVLERKTCLIRKAAGTGHEDQILAANVDVALLTSSLNGDLNPRRMERYLTLVWDAGALPVIVITKADLAKNTERSVMEMESVAPGVHVQVLSAVTGQGMAELETFLGPGKTVVLLGSSGVGKSTLANYLLGEDRLKTQEVREDDDRGRHTTTSRQLVQLKTGALLIDTPGMRELALGDHEEGLERLFVDIEEFALQCKFKDCEHNTEPGCRVKKALETGELSEERMESFLKLQREILFHKRKTDKALDSALRNEWKSKHKSLRAFYKKNGVWK